VWAKLRGKNARPQTLLLKFRLFAPEFRKWQTIVYLDTDVLIRRPIGALARVTGFRAVADIRRDVSSLFNADVDTHQICPDAMTSSTVFNSGVFAFSTASIPTDAYDRIVELALRHLDKSFLVDQPILNLFFINRWKSLPSSYNVLVSLWGRSSTPSLQWVLLQSRILHFGGPSKPSDPASIWHDEWKAQLESANSLGRFSTANPMPSKAFWVPDFIISLAVGLARRRRERRMTVCRLMRHKLGTAGRLLVRTAKRAYRFLHRRGLGTWAKRIARPLSLQAIRGQLSLDASTLCSLSCVSCPQSSGDIKRFLGHGLLSLDALTRMLEDNPWITSLELSNWGEPFMNPAMPAILERCWRTGVKTSFANGTNLNHLNDATAEALVKYGCQEVSCAIDGVTQTTYEKYRQGGDLSAVLENVRRINRFKESYVSHKPRLVWQFILFRHNQHEVQDAKRLATELGMEFRPKLSWGELYGANGTQLCDPAVALAATGYQDREDLMNADPDTYFDWYCLAMWLRPWINYDGRVLGCAINYHGDYGNAFEEQLWTVLNSTKIRQARAMLMGLEPTRPEVPCANCEIYRQRVARGCYVSQEKVLRLKARELSRKWRR
jgi:MoaA/NifB/PqqE/SkfB family radical SAM enzyme